MSTAVVEAHDLGKLFRIYANPWDRFRGALSGCAKRPPHEVWAVKNIDLWVPSGPISGIIGMNGGGKSLY
jgi:ABC-type polysaccharide/polyol phosphate transport system ATPase subunit